ncbi:MAG: polysaccharide deacetylase family protein, partial [Thermoplasmata archaeon]
MKTLRSNEFIWDLFTRKEEYELGLTDGFDRFPSSASLQKDITRPIVSEFLIRNGLSIEFPNDKKFAICLTHDVDFMNSRILAKTARGLPPKLRPWKMIHKTRKILGYSNSIPNLIKMEEAYDAKSTFFLLPLQEGEPDFNYSIEAINDEISELIRSGKEIGLHGGHYSYCDIEKLRNDKNKIEKAIGRQVSGYRNHRLRFRTPLTWNLLEQTGFEYDSTFGYVDAIGFRNGMCHPFRPFDLNKQRFISVIEIPLAIMDTTLFHYM